MLTKRIISPSSSYSHFSSEQNGSEEFYFFFTSPLQNNPEDCLKVLEKNYRKAVSKLQLNESTQIFSRIYFKDISDGIVHFNQSGLFTLLKKSALSWIQQTPIGSGAISLMVYHIKLGEGSLDKVVSPVNITSSQNDFVLKGNHYSMQWCANMTGSGQDSHEQSVNIFHQIKFKMHKIGFSLSPDLLRTWIYVKDIAHNYQGMVDARREFFFDNGFSESEGFPASTGIQGTPEGEKHIISADFLAVSPLNKGQIQRLEAPNNLSPTLDYNVTFDRGLKIKYGNRSHLHISGTASINRHGNVLYQGDIKAQTRRTMENIRELLKSGGANLTDMAFYLIYIKKAEYSQDVLQIFKEFADDYTPFLILAADICRPEWLVEIEGVAILPEKNKYADFF